MHITVTVYVNLLFKIATSDCLVLLFLTVYLGAIAKSNGYFGKGDELLIHLDIVQCSGLERNLVECWSNCCKNNTNHSLDVGVKCQPC